MVLLRGAGLWCGAGCATVSLCHCAPVCMACSGGLGLELPGTGAAASCRVRSRAGILPSGASCRPERGSCPRTGCWVLHEVMEKSAGVPCAQCKPAAAAGGVHLRHKLLPPLCDIAPLAHVGLPESVPRSLPRCRGFAEQGFMSLLSPVPLSLMIFAAALPSHCGGALWKPAHT